MSSFSKIAKIAWTVAVLAWPVWAQQCQVTQEVEEQIGKIIDVWCSERREFMSTIDGIRTLTAQDITAAIACEESMILATDALEMFLNTSDQIPCEWFTPWQDQQRIRGYIKFLEHHRDLAPDKLDIFPIQPDTSVLDEPIKLSDGSENIV